MRKKRTTIVDIARKLGLSHSTISRALSRDKAYMVSEDTRRLVQWMARKMNFRPNLMAKGIATGKTGTLGYLTLESVYESNVTHIDRFRKAVEERNYQLIIGMTIESSPLLPEVDQKSQISQFISRGTDGLFVQTLGDVEESDRIHRAIDGRVPFVTYPHSVRDSFGVVLDYEAGFHRATKHLIDLGHERIGYLGPSWDEPGQDSSAGKGYFKALDEHGLAPFGLKVGQPQVESGYRVAGEVRDRFSALLCCSDFTAVGVCRGMKELGIDVPGDVAVVGYGDEDFSAYVSPSLTTQSVPAREIAGTAVDLMFRQFEGQEMICRVVLDSTLVVRESCGGAPGRS